MCGRSSASSFSELCATEPTESTICICQANVVDRTPGGPLQEETEHSGEHDRAHDAPDYLAGFDPVDGVDGAIDHINQWSSSHTEAIIAEDQKAVDAFMNRIDSAILLHNASTQFADGGEFGMGAEIGIATGKMHARGPVGVEQLTSFKYVVRGSGQVRG